MVINCVTTQIFGGTFETFMPKKRGRLQKCVGGLFLSRLHVNFPPTL